MRSFRYYAGLIGITWLALLVVWVPATVRAGTVGVLMPGRDIPYYEALHRAVVAALTDMGADADIILQRPAPSWMAWKNATRKLVVLDSEVILAYGASTALAVTSEAEAIPLVYCAAYDPGSCGVGPQASGVKGGFDIPGLVEKLHRISHFRKIAILFSHEEPDSGREMKVARAAAEEKGAKVTGIETHDLSRIDFSGNDAVLLTSAANINSRSMLRKIVTRAEREKIATAAVLGLTCEEGVLISRYVDPAVQGRKAAKLVAEALESGEVGVPAGLEGEARTAINITTAKKIGLSIPFDMLGTARVVK